MRSQLRYLLTWIGPQQFAEVVPVDKQASWTDLTKDVRNSITHDGDFTAWIDSGGLLALQLQVRWLLKLAILKHLDVSDDQLVKATLHSAEGRSASYTCRYLPTLQSGVE
ncbi:HEPN domain-containing protein [Cryobacterium breve]|uniref:HEPN domain-containing protein n=1 Tax=Cryobacterium breve TaxID=1259258 RepID=UPI003D7C2D34